MAALKVPVLPVLPVSGYANQPELPAPPIRGKGNGKREWETAIVDWLAWSGQRSERFITQPRTSKPASQRAIASGSGTIETPTSPG